MPINLRALADPAILTIAVPLFVAIVFTQLRFAGKPVTVGSFYVAGRDVTAPVVGISQASAWIWGIALFAVAQKCYEEGVVAALPLIFVNALCLPLLGWLVVKVRRICNDTQKTLPEFALIRDGKGAAAILTVVVLGIQVFSVILHVLGAASLVVFMPEKFDKPTLIVLIAICFFLVAVARGLQSSMTADIFKYVMIAGIVVVAFIAMQTAGGVPAVEGGFAGLRKAGTGLVDAKTFWGFVAPTCAALLSAVVIDEQLYQRGFAARSSSLAASAIAIVPFLVVALGMGVIGSLAANQSLGIQIGNSPQQHQIVNLLTIRQLLPKLPMLLVVTAFMTSLMASGGAALHAAGNVGAKNVAQMIWPRLQEEQLVAIARLTMLLTVLLGTGAALIGVGIFELWIGWGVIRAALFFPMIALITMRREIIPSVFWMMLIGLTASLGTFAWYLWQGLALPVSAGKAILWAWAITFVLLLLQMAMARVAQK